MQEGDGFQGVLGPAAKLAGLKQLRLRDFDLVPQAERWAAALLQLPAGLEHLSINGEVVNVTYDPSPLELPTGFLQRLQQLTYLELVYVELQGPVDDASTALQPLQALTRLVDLRVNPFDQLESITCEMLSGTYHRTHLELMACKLEPCVLAGKSKLQHLHLPDCRPVGASAAAGVAQLLSHLQPLQLTHLGLMATSRGVDEGSIPAAAYSVLTASSKLQHFDISNSCLPPGVLLWPQVFPTCRQLPHLRELNLAHIDQSSGGGPFALAGSRLVSCCPSLQWLSIEGLGYSAELLAALQGLSGLHTLCCMAQVETGVGIEELCQLTRLRHLQLRAELAAKGLLLQLTHLQHLTQLDYAGRLSDGSYTHISLTTEAPDDVPVCRQIQTRHLEHWKAEPLNLCWHSLMANVE